MDAASCVQEDFFRTLELIKECQRVDSRLAAWFNNLGATVVGPLYCPKLSSISSTADSQDLGKIFPVAFYFPALIVAKSLVFYWTALLPVHAFMYFMYEKLTGFMASLGPARCDIPCSCGTDSDAVPATMTCLRHFSMSMLPPLDHRSDWSRVPTRNICQSVEYFLQEQVRGMGLITIIPSLLSVKVCWQLDSSDWSRETMWVDDILRKIQGKGNEIAGYLPTHILSADVRGSESKQL
jgi:hypothetical protein